MVDSMDMALTDDLPNDRSDDVESAISGIPDNAESNSLAERPQVVTVTGISSNVLVTANSNLFNDQETLRATRIIIHDPSSSSLNVLNTGQTVTFNPLNRSLSVPEKNFNWDPSVYDNVLPVRCRNVKGELHKNRFGSGSKGRSILVDNGQWLTPSEFEAVCGRGNSKDWKRSIRYAGRTLMCLIEEGILRPHATSCTCSICYDDNVSENTFTPVTTSGPVRLFTPYKRRKRQNQPKLKVSTNVTNVDITSNDTIVSAPVDLQTEDLTVHSTGKTTETVTLNVPFVTTVVSTDTTTLPGTTLASTTLPILPESVIVTPASTPQTPRCAPTALDFSEQKHWWQLEELVKNAVRNILELQKQVELVKNESAAAREAALKQLKIQMDNEKKEAISACRLEAQVALSKAVLEAKAEKEAAVEKALQQARIEMQEKIQTIVVNKPESLKRCANCDREAYSECPGCHRVSYCNSFCQNKDWQYHREDCEGELDTRSELGAPLCEDPTS